MCNRTVATLVALAFLLGPSPGQSQSEDPSHRRTLNGHTFIPSTQVEDPFIATLVRTQTGAGYATRVATDVTNEVVDSLIQVLEGDLAFIALQFEYQQALSDWLAISAAGSGAARIGTGAQSVIAQGITSIFAFKFRAMARILERENWMLSGTLKLEPVTQFGLDVLDFARRVIEEGKISEDNSLIRKATTYGGSGFWPPETWGTPTPSKQMGGTSLAHGSVPWRALISSHSAGFRWVSQRPSPTIVLFLRTAISPITLPDSARGSLTLGDRISPLASKAPC